MTTFANWLRYYNDLDVKPFLEALTKMRNFYHGYGVDILKDTVLLPGVSFQFVLRGMHKHHKNQPLRSQNGGLRHAGRCSRRWAKFVFTRYHEAGVTRIQFHQYDNASFRKMLWATTPTVYTFRQWQSTCPAGQELFGTTTIPKPMGKPLSKPLIKPMVKPMVKPMASGSMETLLQAIPGVVVYLDDISLAGRNEQEHLSNFLIR